MHKNPVWLFFLAFLSLIVLTFTGTTAYKAYPYFRLDAQTTTSNIMWSPLKIEKWSLSDLMGWEEELFALKGTYEFKNKGRLYEGFTVLDTPLFRNQWAAEQELLSMRSKPVTVWYDSSYPAYSSLQKTFPFKECLSTALLLGVLLYFIWLGFSVGRYTSN